MPKKTQGQTRTSLRINIRALSSLLLLSILINVSILVVLPHHFSFISAAIIIPSTYLLILGRKRTPVRTMQFVAYAGLILSILYAILIYYWMNKGPYGCGGFFGEYSSCVDSSTLQYRLLEILVTPVVFLYTTLPLLLQRKKRT